MDVDAGEVETWQPPWWLLVLSGVAVVTEVPVWVCTAAGLGAAFLGLMLGAMRGFAHG